jgi:hypothetical protein
LEEVVRLEENRREEREKGVREVNKKWESVQG